MDRSTINILDSGGQEVKPYRVHVSSKYLDLTKKKLELTRMPHDPPSSEDRTEWQDGTPKSEVEPLIDFWLEQYDWRSREQHLNSTFPGFRTYLHWSTDPVAQQDILPLRVHFLHIKSPHKHALPLLLIPTFPLTNFSLAPLFSSLTDPASPTSSQPFHLVVPSLPGLGFSDGFQVSDELMAKTAAMFNDLMLRLGYAYYLASGTGAGRDSLAGIDYHLPRILGEEYRDSCLGVHLIEPCVEPPTAGLEWMKFAVVKMFNLEAWGYEKSDLLALAAARRAARIGRDRDDERTPLLGTSKQRYGAAGVLGLREPNTLMYALCDSPVGLLALVLSALKRKSPKQKLTQLQVIDLTQLTWLPGPEAGARFWAAAAREAEGYSPSTTKRAKKSRVAVTVFGSDGEASEAGYLCPAWASSKHVVLFVQRAGGRAGIAAIQRVDEVVDGIRGLAREVERVDGRLRIRPLEEVVVLEEPVVDAMDGEEGELNMQLEVASPATVVTVSPER